MSTDYRPPAWLAPYFDELPRPRRVTPARIASAILAVAVTVALWVMADIRLDNLVEVYGR